MTQVSRNMLRGLLLGMTAGILVASTGCGPDSKSSATTQPVIKYPGIGLRKVPEYLQGTVIERANLQDAQPFLVSGYGLVVNLRKTGDNSAIPTAVREYMVKEIQRHGIGAATTPGYENYSPEGMLRDNRVAVVEVNGYVPPGARNGDHFDVLVSAMQDSYTTSLAHGMLFQSDLRYMGANPSDPGGAVNVYARAQGSVFVNPAHALIRPADMDAKARQSLRYGVIMDGGVSTFDNPLVLRVREPQFSTSRALERRINQRFQGVADKTSRVGTLAMAAAQDEAIILLYVPKVYRGNWEHFAGVVKNLYLNSDPAYLALMAEKLATAAQQPDAPLDNISYAWEGIGQPAMPVVLRLINHKSPEVAYAAARAAMSIDNDSSEAKMALVKIAKTVDNPFRVDAVRTLAELPQSSDTDQYLRQLVNSDNTAVRIEAYKALVRNNDLLIFSKVIQEKYVLDIVPTNGSPMIYVTRRGVPRLAIFGANIHLQTPLTFTALNSRLTLTADKAEGPITIFYRAEIASGDRTTGAIKQLSRPDIADILARLGGEAAPDESRLDFSYADVVALLEKFSQTKKIWATTRDGKQVEVLLNIEEQGGGSDQSMETPRIPDTGRPGSENEDKSVPRIPDILERERNLNPTTRPSGGGN